jgi:hypothetical protein
MAMTVEATTVAVVMLIYNAVAMAMFAGYAAK